MIKQFVLRGNIVDLFDNLEELIEDIDDIEDMDDVEDSDTVEDMDVFDCDEDDFNYDFLYYE